MRGYGRAVRKVLLVVLTLNVLVALAKLVAGAAANSLSLLGDGTHSLIDATNNVVALVLVHFASRPADEDHPYGHAKIETIGAFILGGLLFLAAFELARAAVRRLAEPVAPDISPLTVGVVAVTLVVNVATTWYERAAGKRLASDVLVADATHTLSDVFVSGGVLLGFLAARAGYPIADPLLALVVAVVIGFAGYRVFASATPILTDRIVYDPADVDRLARSVPGVESVHDIRSRGRTHEAYVQMHLVVSTRDVVEAHAITDAVERLIEKELGAKEVFIHVEPEDDASGPPGTRVARG